MYKYIYNWFSRKCQTRQQATVEAICYTLDLSLSRGYRSVDWRGW